MTNVYMYLTAFASAIGGFLFGYEIGIIDTILTMDGFMLYFGTGDSVLQADGTYKVVAKASRGDTDGNIVVAFLIGCMLGALAVMYLAEAFGRRRSISLGALLFTVGGAMQAGAHNIMTLYVGRGVGGCGIGILSMVVPMYISEAAPTHIRGRLIAVQQLMITIGIFIASCINAIIYTYVTGDKEWRLSFAIQCIPGVILFIIMFFLTESPRLMIKKGQDTAALASIAKLRGSNVDDNAVLAEYNEIKEGIQADAVIGNATWSELLRKGILNRVFIGLALQFFQQWTGINVIMYYAAQLFAGMGFPQAQASTTFIIVNNFINFIGTFPGMYFIERIGRKKLLLFGGIGMGIAHCLVCLFYSLSISTGNGHLAWGAVIFVYVFIFFFASTWGPAVWVYQSEIFPLRVRSKGTGLSTFMNWAMNAVIGKVTPVMLEHIQQYTYLVFGGAGFLMAAFTYFFVEETMGRSLEEMDEVFGVVTHEEFEAKKAEAKA